MYEDPFSAHWMQKYCSTSHHFNNSSQQKVLDSRLVYCQFQVKALRNTKSYAISQEHVADVDSWNRVL